MEVRTDAVDTPGSPAGPGSPLERTARLLAWPFANLAEGRPRVLWRVVLFTVLSALALASVGAVTRRAGLSDDVRLADGLLVEGLGRGAAATACVFLATWALDRRRRDVLGCRLDRRAAAEAGLGVLLGAVVIAAAFLVQWALGWVSVTGTLVAAGRASFLAAAAVALLGGLGGSLAEELVFRSYLLRNLADSLAGGRRGGPAALLWASVVSSALFGLVHAGNPNATWLSTLNVAAAGLMLSAGYVLTGRLALSTGLHLSWNFFQGNVFGFAVSGMQFSPRVLDVAVSGPVVWTGGAFGVEGGLVGLLAVVLETGAILAWARGRGLTLAGGALALEVGSRRESPEPAALA